MIEERDLAYEADMRALMRQQLRDDISVEEANEEFAERQEIESMYEIWEDQDTLDQEIDMDDAAP
jgi:hypothetical protein